MNKKQDIQELESGIVSIKLDIPLTDYSWMLYRNCLMSFFFLIAVPVWGANFERSDLIGDNSLCGQIKNAKEAGEAWCTPYYTHDELQTSAQALDEYLALAELKRNITVMAEAQIQSSLLVLKKLGLKSHSKTLKDKIYLLEENGIKVNYPKTSPSQDLAPRYLIAALRYQELTSQLVNNIFKGKEREKVHKKIKLLELKYPLIAQHNFKFFKDFVCQKAGVSSLPKKELPQEEELLDSYLFDGKEFKESLHNSYTGKIAHFRTNDKEAEKLSHELLKELETSFSNQLTPLLQLDSQKECDLWNLHGAITLQVINSSARPEQIFGKACQCQKTQQLINEEIVTGLEVASLGGLGLCLTPSGVGQVLGCPTAMITGLGAGGANTINLMGSLAHSQRLQEQKSIVKFLERNNLNKEEEENIRNKEIEMMKNAGVNTLSGLIGFGVGNIGLKNLIKYFNKGKLANSLKELTEKEREKLLEAVEDLDDHSQTQAFVLLEKLDHDSRDALLKKPSILVNELKKNGISCEL